MHFPQRCSEYQRYKLLRAIHNKNRLTANVATVVQNIKDTNFCEQFTTVFSVVFVTFCCSEYQRYKLLRAIHNDQLKETFEVIVVQNIKDTNFCEQFTTFALESTKDLQLFRISKIQTFASNSQLKGWLISSLNCCSEYQRYKLLRAIHNRVRLNPYERLVVQNIKDTNFCEQFTTLSKSV